MLADGRPAAKKVQYAYCSCVPPGIISCTMTSPSGTIAAARRNVSTSSARPSARQALTPVW